uniref:Uncharacterized protein n=1 Tax=Meloidogyne enterolobii TaxID=390850 RepID=A0A6V7TTR3_MELEN|nr:unnamed protein product [Meloidogyne enterolobii]
MAFLPENNCTAALLYVQFTPLYIVHWLQSLLSLATMISCGLNVAYSLNKGVKETMSFHKNVKIILVGALFLYMIHSLVMFGMHFGYIVLFHVSHLTTDYCIYPITAWKCLLLRIPSYITVAGFTFTHLAMCIERTIATARIHTYEQFTFRLGIFLLAPIFIIPTIWNLWIFHQEDLFNEKAYCMSSSSVSSPRLIIMSYILMGFDIVAVILEMILYRINKRQKINKISDYSVRKSLQLKENDISIRLLLPLSASHTLLFTCYLVLYTSLKFAFDSADGLSYAAAVEGAHLSETLYTLINVSLFLYLRRKLSRTTKLVIVESTLKPTVRVQLHTEQYLKYW